VSPGEVTDAPDAEQGTVRRLVTAEFLLHDQLEALGAAQVSVGIDGRNRIELLLDAGIDISLFNVVGRCRRAEKKGPYCERKQVSEGAEHGCVSWDQG
jgi:hypothetical protein